MKRLDILGKVQKVGLCNGNVQSINEAEFLKQESLDDLSDFSDKI